jgi:hypothetical protein
VSSHANSVEGNLRNCRPISHDERQATRRHYQLTGFLEYDGLPGWKICEVRPQSLRVVHGDFRGEPLIKGELINTIVDRVRSRIDDKDFPFSEDISRSWSDKPPVYVLRTVHNGELYVYDGQKRTFNACFNKDDWIQALVIDVDERRDVVPHS